jgi:ribosome-binding protein aMBF1 (putative translation factor)
MVVYLCDLCGEIRDCTPRQIEKKEYDICADCWNALMSKLKDKGRGRRSAQTVLLPPPALMYEPPSEPRRPLPEEPPEIFAGSGMAN